MPFCVTYVVSLEATAHHRNIAGEWTDPATGKVYADNSIRVSVACHRERLKEAADAVRDIGRQLKQRAMWFEVSGADGVEILDIE